MGGIRLPRALDTDVRFLWLSPAAQYALGQVWDDLRRGIAPMPGGDVLGAVASMVRGFGDRPRDTLAPLLEEWLARGVAVLDEGGLRWAPRPGTGRATGRALSQSPEAVKKRRQRARDEESGTGTQPVPGATSAAAPPPAPPRAEGDIDGDNGGDTRGDKPGDMSRDNGGDIRRDDVPSDVPSPPRSPVTSGSGDPEEGLEKRREFSNPNPSSGDGAGAREAGDNRGDIPGDMSRLATRDATRVREMLSHRSRRALSVSLSDAAVPVWKAFVERTGVDAIPAEEWEALADWIAAGAPDHRWRSRWALEELLARDAYGLRLSLEDARAWRAKRAAPRAPVGPRPPPRAPAASRALPQHADLEMAAFFGSLRKRAPASAPATAAHEARTAPGGDEARADE